VPVPPRPLKPRPRGADIEIQKNRTSSRTAIAKDLMHSIDRLSALCLLALAATAAPLAAQAPAAVAATPSVVAAAPSDSLFAVGIQEGSTNAQTVGTGVWTMGAFVGGAVLGPIGAGLAYALASGSASALPPATVTRLGKKGADYSLAYQQAFTEKLTRRRRSSAMVGGMTGTALFVAGTIFFVAK
jgi:hypothetical protein